MIAYGLNSDVLDTAAPPIPLAAEWSRSYNGRLGPVINLAQGVPGSAPPEGLLQRLQDAAGQPESVRYGDLRGDDELRRAFVNDHNRAYGGDVSADECTITAGCNMAFYAAVMSLARAGDEVILPCPWYFNHEMSLKTLGIKTVPLRCEAPSFLPSLDACEALISSRTRAVVLVTPNNPTGAIYPPQLVADFAQLARKHNVALILDETYRDFLPRSVRSHGLFESGQWRESIIHLFSFSKSYAIPGCRLGAIIAPSETQESIHKLMDCIQICPARSAQSAVAWAVEGIRDWRETVRDELIDRQETFKACMREVPGWQVDTIGAYFAFVKHPFEAKTSRDVAQALASRYGLVVLPGSFFEAPPSKLQAADVGDRYLRFCKSLIPTHNLADELTEITMRAAIANVDKHVLSEVPKRLGALEADWAAFQGRRV